MEFRLLKSFVEVINVASLTKAAENLHLSQPSITTHIKLLEKELDESLIKRKSRKIIPTKRGKEVYEYAVKVLDLERTYKFKWSEEYKKTIMIGAASIPGTYLLPELIDRYHKDKPNVKFNIRIGDSQDIIQYTKDELIDVGLITKDYHDKIVHSDPFCKDKLIVITPNNEYYKSLKAKKTYMLELLKSPLIIREEGSGTRDTQDRYLKHLNINIDQLTISAFVNNNESLIRFVKSGLGIGFISEKAKQTAIRNNEVLVFELNDRFSERDFNVIYSSNHIEDKPLTFEFIDLVKKYYKK